MFQFGLDKVIPAEASPSELLSSLEFGPETIALSDP
jgi:hypothetical protein